MTDENLSVDGLSIDGSAGDVSQPSQEAPPAPVNDQAETDPKLFTQNDVNNMQGAVRRKGFEQGVKAGRTQSQQGTQSQHSGFDELRVKELVNAQIAEVSKQQQAAAEDQLHKDHAAKIYRSIDANVDECLSKDEIPAFKAAMERVNGFANFPAVLDVVHTLGNSAEVLLHLAGDEGIDKLAAMSILSYEAVSDRLQKISNGLKQNQNAKKSPTAPNPISQIEPTTNGIGQSGASSLEDFKGMFLT